MGANPIRPKGAKQVGSDALRRTIKAATEWGRGHRHDSIKAQHLALTRKLNGHYNYYGANGNRHQSLRH
jgi:hypothetical protein